MQDQINQSDFSKANSSILQDFYTDVINTQLYNTPITFLQKYDFITHYREVLDSQSQVTKACQQIVKINASKKQQIQPIIADLNLSQNQSIALYKSIRSKFMQIYTHTINHQVRHGSAYIINYDWKIINILSSNTNTRRNKVLMNLTLIIGRQGQDESIVNLQLTSQQLIKFVNTLKQVKKQLNTQGI